MSAADMAKLAGELVAALSETFRLVRNEASHEERERSYQELKRVEIEIHSVAWDFHSDKLEALLKALGKNPAWAEQAAFNPFRDTRLAFDSLNVWDAAQQIVGEKK